MAWMRKQRNYIEWSDTVMVFRFTMAREMLMVCSQNMKENGIEIVNRVKTAQLSIKMGQYTQAVSKKIIWRVKVNLNGHLGMFMKANGKNLKWKVKVNLDM